MEGSTPKLAKISCMLALRVFLVIKFFIFPIFLGFAELYVPSESSSL